MKKLTNFYNNTLTKERLIKILLILAILNLTVWLVRPLVKSFLKEKTTLRLLQ